MAGARQVLGRSAEFHQHRRLVDQVARALADDVDAEHPVGRLVGKDLHEAFGRQHGARPAVGGERELAGHIGDAGLFQLFLGLADRGHFRLRVDHRRDDAIVHMARLPGDPLGHRHALVLGLVRQHRALDHVAERPDAFHRGVPVVVDLDAAATVEHDAGVFETEAFRVGLAAGRHQHDVGLQRFGIAALDRLEGHFGTLSGLGDSGHLGAGADRHALLFQHALELFRHIAVHAAEHRVEIFDHGDLGAEPHPDRTQFEPDHAAAHHDHGFRHLG